jgi:hypothetical protein
MDSNPKPNSAPKVQNVYLINPIWLALFLGIGGIIIIPTGIVVLFLTGLSSASDRVFAVEAFITGVITVEIFKRWFKKKLVVAPKITSSFLYFWALFCLYIFVYGPFESID